MNSIKIQYYTTDFGELILGSFEEKLCLCDWRYRKKRETVDNRLQKGLNAKFIEAPSEVLSLTINQLEEYFHQERQNFDIPLFFVGTAFQKSVWNALLNIEYGSTSTYLKLSQGLGNKDAIRAVANANGANAISIIIPCHRIIGSDGDLIGYAGGLETKTKLLKLENPAFGKKQDLQLSLEF
ncbi:MAG: methylated-DNA--[protein]-cysteine S-methyltransferase [Raineya sp.]|jgi:methylated-DNA-[protein]-cysteine S-methyltransferase|nr:methylated-DNA--[protein]-cysteine S-methyltransferase [Raineya sp.]